jgi:UDP-N-acetylglucosamine 2-epimerase (non-hydrolysing)
MHLLHVVGARPNFPKLAPVFRAAKRAGARQTVVHTGQHYDDAMSGEFFRTLELSPPDVNLEVGSASHAVQTARIMERIEPVLDAKRPTWVVVYGDVNSTVAAALVAAKKGMLVAHVEAGLRSGDWTMPEEVNRVVTDRLADLLLTPSRDGDVALMREGVPRDRIVFVGNVMIDSLLHALPAAKTTGARGRLAGDGEYVLVTLHRPSNVDDATRLRRIASSLRVLAKTRRVLFPMHPRTKTRAEELGVSFDRVTTIAPLAYLEMVDVLHGAVAVVTDSGGVQEETTALGVRCFTLRPNTERPVTIQEGTNVLVPEPEDLEAAIAAPLGHKASVPEGWDGHAADRVVAALTSHAKRLGRA